MAREGEFCDDLGPEIHEPCDFHWLHLDRFSNLKSLKIWVSTHRAGKYSETIGPPISLEQADLETLGMLLSGLANVESVFLSAPLSKQVEPDEGYVEGISENGRLKGRRNLQVMFYYDQNIEIAWNAETVSPPPVLFLR
ncbi:hypothetical protein CEP54_011950 [Fusarium duplospermum]|uniref:Uncharacterized protein n=1 Tax=Fusarium duplospermum TaxID=1325734 RepID=A0A428PBD7_9HYPO|nr:hypothetical protein CEP54_011950 [Fusarium duplospermum]